MSIKIFEIGIKIFEIRLFMTKSNKKEENIEKKPLQKNGLKKRRDCDIIIDRKSTLETRKKWKPND